MVSAGRDVILELEGNDSVWVHGGNDLIHGNVDDEKLFGGAGNDPNIEDAGDNGIDDTYSLDTMGAAAGNDHSDGGDDSDTLDTFMK